MAMNQRSDANGLLTLDIAGKGKKYQQGYIAGGN